MVLEHFKQYSLVIQHFFSRIHLAEFESLSCTVTLLSAEAVAMDAGYVMWTLHSGGEDRRGTNKYVLPQGLGTLRRRVGPIRSSCGVCTIWVAGDL